MSALIDYIVAILFGVFSLYTVIAHPEHLERSLLYLIVCLLFAAAGERKERVG